MVVGGDACSLVVIEPGGGRVDGSEPFARRTQGARSDAVQVSEDGAAPSSMGWRNLSELRWSGMSVVGTTRTLRGGRF